MKMVIIGGINHSAVSLEFLSMYLLKMWYYPKVNMLLKLNRTNVSQVEVYVDLTAFFLSASKYLLGFVHI